MIFLQKSSEQYIFWFFVSLEDKNFQNTFSKHLSSNSKDSVLSIEVKSTFILKEQSKTYKNIAFSINSECLQISDIICVYFVQSGAEDPFQNPNGVSDV